MTITTPSRPPGGSETPARTTFPRRPLPLRFFVAESVRHFREEEERLFPLVADSEKARPLVVRALLEHQQVHALARRLASGERAPTRDLAELLEAHVRFEERELFPVIERLVGDRLRKLGLHRLAELRVAP